MLPLLIVALTALPPALVDRSIDVNGTTIHIRCGGERKAGQPLVLLEAGGFNSADTWLKVHAPIAEFSRVCAYDRPGRGTSDELKRRATAVQYVDFVQQLLMAAGEKPPYVMVGHSIGGVLAMLYAVQHPSEVSALVLVDSSHEDQVRRFRALPQSKNPPPPPTAVDVVPVPELLDALAQKPWRADIPLVVLSHGRAPAGTSPDGAAREAIWRDLQREHAARSRKSEHIVARNSGHYIHNDEPQLVIDAVRRMLTLR